MTTRTATLALLPTDRRGNQQVEVRDQLGRLSSITAGGQLLSRYEYDVFQSRTSMFDGRGNRTTYQYDAFDRVSSVNHADIQTETFSYDSNGNLTTYFDGRGGNLTQEFDDLNRMTARIDGVGDRTEYRYDQRGLLAELHEEDQRMGWVEKVRKIISLLPSRPELSIVFDAPQTGVPAEFLDWLRTKFPFVHDEYVNYLRLFDGLQLDMYVLFGSDRSAFPTLSSRLSSWESRFDASAFMPIGENAAGDVFLLSKSGGVYLLALHPSSETRYVAESFDALMDDFFLGNKYLLLFPFGRTDSEWLELLTEQNWLK